MLSVFRRKKETEPAKKADQKVIRDEPFFKKEFIENKPVHTISSNRMFDVKPHKSGGWQVIEHNKDRARRRFKTLTEAKKYCVKEQLNYHVYKKDGTITE